MQLHHPIQSRSWTPHATPFNLEAGLVLKLDTSPASRLNGVACAAEGRLSIGSVGHLHCLFVEQDR